MKPKLVRLLIAGFALAILGAATGQYADGSRQYQGLSSEGIGAAKLFDDGLAPICYPGDQLCRPKFDGGSHLVKLFDGPFPVPICYPGDRDCRLKFDRLELIYFPGKPYSTELFDGPFPEPICYPGDQLCRPKG
jgi:hypothetical protein